VSITFLSLSIAVFPVIASSPNFTDSNAHERTAYYGEQVETLLHEVNDELGGSNLKIAKIQKYLGEIVDLSCERTRYNIDAAISRRNKKSTNIKDAYSELANLKDDSLIEELHKLVNNHHSVGYRDARHEMFTDLDSVDGEVECVYTGRHLKTNSIPNPSNMNCEHTWPQSQGAVGVARTDIHHLFCTDSKSNSHRSSLPFGTVTDPKWSQGGSSKGNGCFEVRDVNKGNTARAKFYFSIRYGKRIGSREERVLKQWHKADPVDADEMERNNGIEKIQKNRNPFIDHPEFVEQINNF